MHLNLDLRATQDAAISLYERSGFKKWGTNPAYALVQGKLVSGHHYSKQLRKPPRAKKAPSRKPKK